MRVIEVSAYVSGEYIGFVNTVEVNGKYLFVVNTPYDHGKCDTLGEAKEWMYKRGYRPKN